MSYDNLSNVSQNVLKFYQQLTGEERRIPDFIMHQVILWQILTRYLELSAASQASSGQTIIESRITVPDTKKIRILKTSEYTFIIGIIFYTMS
jgi:hypothetical protein